MPDILSGLIWVQTVCKCYQQTTPAGKEFIVQTLLRTSHYACVLMIYVKLYGTMVNDR